ncbi:MAG TPA: hypothetical protein VGN63_10375 [Flavisolibacter sp.]|jgi:hypothetical protein|nr:hypothetical protein [Flavisolibacter sp.]
MAENNKSKDTPYNEERNTEPHRQTGNINSRNNNVEVSTSGAEEPNVEGANNAGIGDAAVNDQKLTKYTSNRSGDA